MQAADRGVGPPNGPGGAEPDVRFTLANERTFLAWARTSLALIVAGVAMAEVVAPPDVAGGGRGLGLLLVLGGLLVALGSYGRWRTVDTAIRAGRAVPESPLPRRLGPFLGVAGAAAFVLVALAGLGG